MKYRIYNLHSSSKCVRSNVGPKLTCIKKKRFNANSVAEILRHTVIHMSSQPSAVDCQQLLLRVIGSSFIDFYFYFILNAAADGLLLLRPVAHTQMDVAGKGTEAE